MGSSTHWNQCDGRTFWWNDQVNRLEVLSLEVEDVGHIGVQRPMVANAKRPDQARQDGCTDLGSHASKGNFIHKVFYRHDSIQQLQ